MGWLQRIHFHFRDSLFAPFAEKFPNAALEFLARNDVAILAAVLALLFVLGLLGGIRRKNVLLPQRLTRKIPYAVWTPLPLVLFGVGLLALRRMHLLLLGAFLVLLGAAVFAAGFQTGLFVRREVGVKITSLLVLALAIAYLAVKLAYFNWSEPVWTKEKLKILFRSATRMPKTKRVSGSPRWEKKNRRNKKRAISGKASEKLAPHGRSQIPNHN